MRTIARRFTHDSARLIAAALALAVLPLAALADGVQDARPPAGLAEVRRSGEGSSTLVLIPGLGFGASVFDAFAATHLEGLRIISVSLPGFAEGDGPKPPAGSPDTPTPWLDAAEGALRRLIAAEAANGAPVFVVGHSLGGHLALRLSDVPEIAGVVSIDGRPVYAAAGLPAEVTGAERGERAWAVHADAIARVPGNTWRERFAQAVRIDVPTRGAELAAELRKRDPAWLQHAYIELLATDARPRLAASNAPVLIVAGDTTGIRGGTAGLEPTWRQIMEGTGGPVEVAVVEGGGHWSFINRPRRTAEVIRGFLTGIAGP